MASLYYSSTRGAGERVTASQAVLKGLADDGGLFVPETIPALPDSLENLAKLSYQELAKKIMGCFLADYTEEELSYCIEGAYDEKFDTPSIAPLHQVGSEYFLELFHGKTIAFKDMALSVLPYLMTVAAKKNSLQQKIIILTATSGDTGKAAMAGFADVPGTGIIVFYPKDGVSPVQEKQMVTQTGDNTCVIAIRGNFDDAQRAVKKMFSDKKLAEELLSAGYVFSSANSINIGRLVPQVVYYIYAYLQLMNKGAVRAGEQINVVVPTGNFGNILAAYYAKKMGLPVKKLICASNRNKVLTDFFATGVYDRRREFYLTSSPSMDILVSSNLERLIYEIAGCDAAATKAFMDELSEKGLYTLTEEMKARLADFCAGFASEEETAAAIKKIYDADGYVIDTHTAVGAAVLEKYRAETGDETIAVTASTASPFKFARSVLHAIDPACDGHTDEEQFADLERVSGVARPAAIRELETAKVRHTGVTDEAGMEAAVKAYLGI